MGSEGPVLASAFRSVGLQAFSVVGRDALASIAEVSDPEAVRRYDLPSSSGAVVVAFPYYPREAAEPPPGRDPEPYPGGPPPYLRVGAFASSNRYAALARLLLGAGRALARETGLPPGGFRAIVNSRLPEKRLAATAGLGFLGRSSLLVSDAYGPACVLGALLLPRSLPFEPDAEPADPGRLVEGRLCGSCRACVDACPTGAIRADLPGSVALPRCIQYWSARAGEVPDPPRSAWGRRLYGCDACVRACPRSAGAYAPGPDGPSPADRAEALILPAERRPGPFVSMAFIEAADDAAIKAYFRKTALGLSWIRGAELRRNARLSAAPKTRTI